MNVAQCIEYIHGKFRKGSIPGLHRIGELLQMLGNPEKELKFVHIAGTNGKGSTGAMLEAGLRHCGFRTGFYSSPHLVDVRERFRVDGRAADEDSLARAFERVDRAAEVLRREGAKPTFFEVTTAMAALIFQEAGADFVVWETGMGGRLDATSVVTPEAAIITNIALDHQKYLGGTIAEIAAEKAGILRPECPLFTGFLAPEAQEVIAARASELGCAMTGPDAPDTAGEPVYGRDAQGITQTFSYRGRPMTLHLAGAMQRRNFLTAAPVLRHLAEKYGFSFEQALAGAGLARWPARCQVVSENLVVDGGHNPDGAQALAQAMREAFPGRRFAVVFAGFQDKDVAANLQFIAPLAAQWIFTPIAGDRPSYPAQELMRMAREAGSDAPSCAAPNSRAAMAEAQTTGLPVLAVGSLYLAGEVLREYAPETVYDL